jgi:hypothetical protein
MIDFPKSQQIMLKILWKIMDGSCSLQEPLFFYKKSKILQMYKLRHGVLSNCTNVSATHRQNTRPLGAV